jgi:hypothetical protein
MTIRASSRALCIVCFEWSTNKCMPIWGNKMALSKYFGTRWCCPLERHCTNIITTPDWKDTMRIRSGEFVQVISYCLGTVVLIDQVWETVSKPSCMWEMLLKPKCQRYGWSCSQSHVCQRITLKLYAGIQLSPGLKHVAFHVLGHLKERMHTSLGKGLNAQYVGRI